MSGTIQLTEQQLADLLAAKAGGAPERWIRGVFKYAVVPLLIFWHLAVLSTNLLTFVDINMIVFKTKLSLSFIILNAMLYGIFLATCLLYLRQQRLLQEKAQLQAQLAQLQSQVPVLQRRIEKMNSAASQILVPYRLDALVDKGLEDFAAENYKPGILQAGTRSTSLSQYQQ